MSGKRISLIAAVAQNRVIGSENRLPWHLPADLKRFRALTSGHPVIMGRKTYESIGRPLPNRVNIVISRNVESTRAKVPAGVKVTRSLEEAVQLAEEVDPSEIFVIGGAEIYRLALPRANRLYLTLVHLEVPGDAFFPEWREENWIEQEKQQHPAEEMAPAYTYLTLDRG